MCIYTWFDLYYRNAPASADATDSTPKPRGRPLYDVPYMFEAREFLRKKLIGKKVDLDNTPFYNCTVSCFK